VVVSSGVVVVSSGGVVVSSGGQELEPGLAVEINFVTPVVQQTTETTVLVGDV
jgi:hypothetical protein